MPSNFTEHFNLSQWEPTDQVLREDFNADNAKLDAALAGKGNCQVIMGSYTGTGQYGEAHPNTITFHKKPLLLLIHYKNMSLTVLPDCDEAVMMNGSRSGSLYLTAWTKDTFSWYSTSNSATQMNSSGVTYFYTAFFAV